MDIASRVISVMSRSMENKESCVKEKEKRVGMVMDVSDNTFIGGLIPAIADKQKYPYSRPDFLFLSEDEVSVTADHSIRPVICPKFPSKMPLYAGYAEVISAGKTSLNEDQASARLLSLSQCGYEPCNSAQSSSRSQSGRKSEDEPLLTPGMDDELESPHCAPRAEAALFGLFDGHAGSSVAIVASRCLHEHIKSRMSEVLEAILTLDRQENMNFGKHRADSSYSVTALSDDDQCAIRSDHLVKGALETAFVDMDEQISEDKQVWRLPGGCAAVTLLVFLGKLYVANAGDSRAILVTAHTVKALSRDLTPATERKRLQQLAYQSPELLGNSFSRLEYNRRLTKKDLKKKVLYRDWYMDGWAVKTVKESDLKPPLISSFMRKRRLLNTIGVSRGFGDHHLLTVDDHLSIKPFLSPIPEVTVTPLRDLDTLTDKDVVIIATDGLWDVISNEDAGLIVRSALGSSDPTDMSRYSQAAQELVIAARGNITSNNNKRWTMNCGGHASCDDITAFVIPLKYCAAPPTNIEPEEDDDDIISIA